MIRTIDLCWFLRQVEVEASAPGRIDCGGTWDQKSLALLKEQARPVTVNIALQLRTTVRLGAFEPGRVRVDSMGFASAEGPVDRPPFQSSLGLIFAILSHFHVSGVKVTIHSELVPRSGLGGSGVAAVAVIGALAKSLECSGHGGGMSGPEIALLAHNIEDGLRVSYTGLEDQLAAVHGGVNKWIWRYSRSSCPYEREVLLERESYERLERRILVVDTGEARDSSRASARYIESFLSGGQDKWMRIRDLTDDFADAIREERWSQAAACLREESRIREEILSGEPIPLASALKNAASERGCGAGFAGGNYGGYLWAIGEEEAIAELRGEWSRLLERFGKGCLLQARISPTGLAVRCCEREEKDQGLPPAR
jgi:D-glycero-alpha-D-manno-heptose-7-phosphate kinase